MKTGSKRPKKLNIASDLEAFQESEREKFKPDTQSEDTGPGASQDKASRETEARLSPGDAELMNTISGAVQGQCIGVKIHFPGSGAVVKK